MNILDALDALCALIGAAEGLPPAISGFAAMIARARAEKRDIQPAEIALLKSDDDELSKALDAAIDAARSNA